MVEVGVNAFYHCPQFTEDIMLTKIVNTIATAILVNQIFLNLQAEFLLFLQKNLFLGAINDRR